MGSEGFIQDPATKETKRFHRDEKSWIRDPMVFVDTGVPITGEPPLLKTCIHLRRDAAEQRGKQLHSGGVEASGPVLGCFCSALETRKQGVHGGQQRPFIYVVPPQKNILFFLEFFGRKYRN